MNTHWKIDFEHALSFVDMEKYGQGASSTSRPANEEFSVNSAAVDEYVHDRKWFLNLRLLRIFSQCERRAVRWANSCSCHWNLDERVQQPDCSPAIRRLYAECPLRARRAADLAAGEFFDDVIEHLRLGAGRLEMELSGCCAAEFLADVL